MTQICFIKALCWLPNIKCGVSRDLVSDPPLHNTYVSNSHALQLSEHYYVYADTTVINCGGNTQPDIQRDMCGN